MEKLAIQSDMSNIVKVEDFVSRICSDKNINNYYATISMSVLQAVENAIIHGNNSDSTKMVTVISGECRGGVFFEIHDEGCGFDWKAYGEIPDSGVAGEGIFLMKVLSDNMQFLDSGRTVRLDFLVRGIDESVAARRSNALENYFASTKVIV